MASRIAPDKPVSRIHIHSCLFNGSYRDTPHTSHEPRGSSNSLRQNSKRSSVSEFKSPCAAAETLRLG